MYCFRSYELCRSECKILGETVEGCVGRALSHCEWACSAADMSTRRDW